MTTVSAKELENAPYITRDHPDGGVELCRVTFSDRGKQILTPAGLVDNEREAIEEIRRRAYYRDNPDAEEADELARIIRESAARRLQANRARQAEPQIEPVIVVAAAKPSVEDMSIAWQTRSEPVQTRNCSRCQTPVALADFPVTSAYGKKVVRRWCKACLNQYYRDHSAAKRAVAAI